ncbi:MoaD/ThiS family protein [Simiduia agarivorans]|uniref:ThiS family protein n=1 Tax=Simiduia agarivorans (strain DSM 21679 / JCM 13881 / BCRC 17597 / SA1) TaxID=1117647 RepID=K4KPY0_SIMAS|nr:MoaD/ThiS family protein [Simiduia agarivorans]AFV00154.1 hypothetical protein M5M_15095 [Simiduia agarivorans SA1 = DSM 21679]
MASVEVTQHLYRYFPVLENNLLTASGATVRQVLDQVNLVAPGFLDYVLDERGHVRRHVNICVNQSMIADRVKLSDPVTEQDRVFIFQALSGG